MKIREIEDKVVEECGELLQAISKARRFGYDNFHPNRPESNNGQEIIEEIMDMSSAMYDLHKYIYYKKYKEL